MVTVCMAVSLLILCMIALGGDRLYGSRGGINGIRKRASDKMAELEIQGGEGVCGLHCELGEGLMRMKARNPEERADPGDGYQNIGSLFTIIISYLPDYLHPSSWSTSWPGMLLMYNTVSYYTVI